MLLSTFTGYTAPASNRMLRYHLEVFGISSSKRTDMALTALYRQGQVYVRRLVHDMLGGQEQGGISTPRAAPVILLFSTEQGADYGYQDGWKPDGLYHTQAKANLETCRCCVVIVPYGTIRNTAKY